jgi:U3 small nucleolar RNA-associated protein 15
MLPGGSTLLSAGGNQICVWDLIAGKLQASFSHHQKTITSMCLDGTANRLLTAGLDQQVKIVDTKDWALVHTMKFNAPLLSIAVSPDNARIAAGMSDGMLAVRHRGARNLALVASQKQRAKTLRTGTYRYYLRGSSMPAKPEDYVVAERKRHKLHVYDAHLKKFEYGAALDSALATGDVSLVAALVELLERQRAIQQAISGRSESQLVPLLRFLVQNIAHPRHAAIFLRLAQDLFERYVPIVGHSITIDQLFVTLAQRLKDELQAQRQLMQLLGTLDTIIATAALCQPVATI